MYIFCFFLRAMGSPLIVTRNTCYVIDVRLFGSKNIIPYLLVFKPLGLIYEVGLRFEFKPPGAYKRNVLIWHVMCSTRLFAYKPPPIYLNSEYICTIDDFQGFTQSVLPYKVMYMTIYIAILVILQSTTRKMHVYRVIARALVAYAVRL